MEGNTNLTDEKIGKVKSDSATVQSETVTLPTAWGEGTLKFTKRNGVVTLTKSGTIKNGSTTETNIGDIPTGFLPSETVSRFLYDYNYMQGTTYAKVPAIRILLNKSTGKITGVGYVKTGEAMALDSYIMTYVTTD